MGSGESAEATAAFFNKTYGENDLTAGLFKDEHPQHRVESPSRSTWAPTMSRGASSGEFVADTGYKTDAEKGEEPGRMGLEP